MNDLQYAKVAKISYLLDVGRTDGGSITLGTVGAVRAASGAELLVVVCRAKLDDAEHVRMDWITRDIVADPAKFFMREIVAATKAKVPDLFAHLSQKFAWSLHVAPATEVPISPELAQDLRQAFGQLVSDHHTQAAQPGRRRRLSKIIELRPPNPAATALARITGPEFLSGNLVALLPPAWMISEAFPESLTQ